MDQVGLVEGLQGLNEVTGKLCTRIQEISERLYGPAPTNALPSVPSRQGLLGSMDHLVEKIQCISVALGQIENGVGTAPMNKAVHTGISHGIGQRHN